MDTKTLKDRLTNFLLAHCVLAEFSENVQNFHGVSFDEYIGHYIDELENRSPEYVWIGEWAIIIEAFQWSETPQGDKFWGARCDEWKELCGNN